MEAPRHRVLVVDDHEIVHLGLRMLFQQLREFVICGEARTAQTARELAKELQPDIIVTDMMLGAVRDGIAMVRDLRAEARHARILVYTMLDEMRYARRALQAGASGYVMKSEGSGTVGAALCAIGRGERFVSHEVQQSLLQDLTGGAMKRGYSEEGLSDGEMRVFRLLGTGLGSARIAEELGLSQKTISSYRERIKDKLGLQSSRDLERRAEEFFREEKLAPPGGG